MSNTRLTYIRAAATAAITALAVLYSYYPSDIWITTVVAAAGAVGIHAIPAIQQGITTVVPVPAQKRIVTVSEQPEVPSVAPQHNLPATIDGLALMGLRTPVTDAGQAETVPTPEPTPVPETPVTAPTAPVVGTADSPVTPASLRQLANFLENLG